MSQEPADPKRLVQHGYDRIAERYGEWAASVRGDERERYASVLFQTPMHGARVLELGCGPGSAVTVELADRFRLIAVDVSTAQLQIARTRAPAADVLLADMATLEFAPRSFDAVVAFYSIIHLPREEHAGLLCRIATWLRPGGMLVATMGARSTEAGYDADWLGAPMFWSHFDSDTNRRLVEEAGLKLVTAREETADEHGRPATFLWIVAQAPVRLPGGR